MVHKQKIKNHKDSADERRFLGVKLPNRRSPTRVSEQMWRYVALSGATGTKLEQVPAQNYFFKPLEMAFKPPQMSQMEKFYFNLVFDEEVTRH